MHREKWWTLQIVSVIVWCQLIVLIYIMLISYYFVYRLLRNSYVDVINSKFYDITLALFRKKVGLDNNNNNKGCISFASPRRTERVLANVMQRNTVRIESELNYY